MKSSGIIGTIFKVLLPVVIIAAGLGITGVLSALKTEPVKNDEPLRAAAVFVEAAELVDYTQAVKSQGEVRPQREIIIAPQINGRIDWISDDYLVGSFVKKGQILARLEIQDFELAQIRAESTVAAARQALAREEAEAEVARQDIIDLGLSLEQASPLARREPQLAQARADLQGALASLKDAELALTRTAIVAPFDGVISEKTVDIGQFASPGSSLGRMFSIETFEVSLPITDTELGRIGLPLAFNETADRPGPEVIFTANVLGADRRWVGRVTRTDALINAQTRQINIFTELDDPYGAGRDGDTPMVPGLFVNASIDGITLPNVIKVPRDALRGADTVLVANEDETISVRKVDVAISNTSGAYL
ncbi:MAG: efflux RND transporter periplasmic adaptor subunit, partial [Pseudomonadota bacterium]